MCDQVLTRCDGTKHLTALRVSKMKLMRVAPASEVDARKRPTGSDRRTGQEAIQVRIGCDIQTPL